MFPSMQWKLGELNEIINYNFFFQIFKILNQKAAIFIFKNYLYLLILIFLIVGAHHNCRK